MYPITLTNCLKYIARVIYGKRKNRDFLHLLLFLLLNDLAQSWGKLQAIKIMQSRLDTGRTHDPLMQFVPFRRRLWETRKFPQYATPFYESRVRSYFR